MFCTYKHAHETHRRKTYREQSAGSLGDLGRLQHARVPRCEGSRERVQHEVDGEVPRGDDGHDATRLFPSLGKSWRGEC